MEGAGVNRHLAAWATDSAVASPIFFAVFCCDSGSTDRDKKRLNKLIKRASYVLDCPLDAMEEMGERRISAKLMSILNNTSRPPA